MKNPLFSPVAHNPHSRHLLSLVISAFALCWFPLSGAGQGADAQVTFAPSAGSVSCYEFLEVALNVASPSVANPFTDVVIEGTFGLAGEKPVSVDGFCDSADGRVFRIRFMPAKPGEYQYVVKYRAGGTETSHHGTFKATDQQRKGLVRVDPEFPMHFQWTGTKERYFWNGTTAYWLAGWDEESIARIVDRFDALKVTRVRVALNGRVKDGQAWFEPVYQSEKFSFLLNPWVAKTAASVETPGFDVTRFNTAYWQKFERLLGKARDRDLVVSVIFYVDGWRPGVDPFGKTGMGGPDEQRYYRYAVARLGAYANVMWDLANEYRSFRDDSWAEKMGALLKQWDPYNHLTSVHGYGDFHFRTSPWADYAMYQSWDEHGGGAYMLKNLQEQAKTGRIIPQVNEEYGYEDHYPRGWGEDRVAPSRSAETRRRIAWEIYLAGGYQTTGERANRGAVAASEAGGGWINGGGGDTMPLLKSFVPLYDFFTGISFWKLHPDPELVVSTRPRERQSSQAGAPPPRAAMAARSDRGDLAVIYFPEGGVVTLKANVLQDGLGPLWYSPRDNGVKVLRALRPNVYQAPDTNDWLLVLSTPCDCSFREHDNEFEK